MIVPSSMYYDTYLYSVFVLMQDGTEVKKFAYGNQKTLGFSIAWNSLWNPSEMSDDHLI